MSAEPAMSAEDDKTDPPRQPIVRQRGARRAKLLPAPNTDPSPDVPVEREDGGVAAGAGPSGENDDRLRRDRPPHW